MHSIVRAIDDGVDRKGYRSLDRASLTDEAGASHQEAPTVNGPNL
jgi:hypothetical protein